MQRPTFRLSSLAAALWLAGGAAFAAEPSAEPAFISFNGEAAAPEVEARHWAVQASTLSRREVIEEFYAAREAGTLALAGEAGDTEAVLAARVAYAEAQTARALARAQAEEAERLAALQRQQAATVTAQAPADTAAAGEAPAAEPSQASVEPASEPAATEPAIAEPAAKEELPTEPAKDNDAPAVVAREPEAVKTEEVVEPTEPLPDKK
jgi:hypothetical protein